MPPPKSRAGSPPLVRYQQILEAARTTIEEHGPDALTGEIVLPARLTRPDVGHHFSSKDDLAYALARRAYHELRTEIQARLYLPGTPLDAIRALIETQVRWADSQPNLYRLLVSCGYRRRSQQCRVGRSDLAAEITAAAIRYFPRLADDLDALEATLLGLIGLCDASILQWLSQPVGTREQLIDRLAAQAWLILEQHLRNLGIHVD
jgi:AcrR family transcriptional regulator